MEEEASDEELAKVDTGEALDEGTGAAGCCSAEFCKHTHTRGGGGERKIKVSKCSVHGSDAQTSHATRGTRP